MGVRVTKDTTGLDALRSKMQPLRVLSLSVGVQGSKGMAIHTPGGPNVATVALHNEFGTQDIPARSFLRGALFEARERIQAFIAGALEKYIATPKADALSMLSRIGKFVAGLVRTRIETTSHWARANAPSTIAQKGFNRPLHETDKLAKSITWAVRGPGGAILAEGPGR